MRKIFMAEMLAGFRPAAKGKTPCFRALTAGELGVSSEPSIVPLVSSPKDDGGHRQNL